MATKVFLCIFLFSLALPFPSHARPYSKPKVDEKPSSFESIKHLEGCQKGYTVKGLQQLKAYLEAFGYLDYSHNQTHAKNDHFDDSMEAASHKRTKHTNNTVADYVLFPGNLQWPPTKYQLTYGFPPGTHSDAISVVARAFNTWSSQTQFTFSQSQDFESADLKIGFCRGDHGDGFPFQPNNGVLAHSFAPTDGRFHFNGDYSFSDGPVAGSFDLETVALHEIGHLLGLMHSQVQDAIMWPTIPPVTTKALTFPTHARPYSKPKADEKPSSFESIKHLEGCQKGHTVKGLQQLKAYLGAFGYLNYSHNQTHAKNDHFDDSMKAAVKMYQLNYHLETTGTLDAQTLSAMTAPRCGVPNIINGTNWMQASQKRTKHTNNTVADYILFPGNL
ncbi:hypothetical protein Vadar_018574 [Vaccinium darrowii]|uniref:Uncharacterized protein n=1 Tax=Vaccinium darrowii TaxID=229202 RepID=A0ACB7YN79_9ERIC|nr:hypothetical protein Vadar_018574 [Vaccinium darrowii]